MKRQQAVNENPINFRGDMIRAILAGRKTKTRRLMKPQPTRVSDSGVLSYNWGSGLPQVLCPYGAPGDRLWAREIFAYCIDSTDYNDERFSKSIEESEYKRDCKSLNRYHIAYHADEGYDDIVGPWKPSIHMPRWASRITLEIVKVSVEHLQDISEKDAHAEGVPGELLHRAQGWSPRAFQLLWGSIYGTGSWESWEANPWVWVIEFKKVTE